MGNNFAAPNNASILNQRYIEEENETGLITREPFQRDRDRIIHCRAFRRLMHKTQIFNSNKGDHFRNRLTHSLEVSQIARSIGKALALNDELIEAIALGHDLGHTPFGHVGERTLHMILAGKAFDNNDIKIPGNEGFKHNFQGLQIVDNIETTSDKYEGMNLTIAVREGILKHTKMVLKYHHINDDGKLEECRDNINYSSLKLNEMNIHNCSFTLEGQVVAIADEIAQCTHDLEDGIRSGIISIKDVVNVELVKNIVIETEIVTDDIKETVDARNMLIKVMVGYLINDVYKASNDMLNTKFEKTSIPKFANIEDVYKEEYIVFSDETKKLVKDLSEQIRRWVLVSQEISKADSKAEYLIKQIFKAYYIHPLQLPDYILRRYYSPKGIELNRVKIQDDIPNMRKDINFCRLICDHIGSMTDQYVAREYKQLYEPEKL